MTHSDEKLNAFVAASFRSSMMRPPSPREAAIYVKRLRAGEDPVDISYEITSCQEAKDTTAASLFVPPGHYYSPIVDPAQLDKSLLANRRAAGWPVGIALDMPAMRDLFERLRTHFGRITFPVSERRGNRYWYENEFFSYGDGLILSAMICEMRPRRIVEVGSGFSSACALDTVDKFTEAKPMFTFIEPYPHRLRALLTRADLAQVCILEEGIQTVDLAIFEELESHDILFLDTTHIVKTGSDVCYELFDVLPRLRPGVVIHFHDVFHDWEYPDGWVFDNNRSWNEIYALRAFLMYNTEFEIIYFNDYFAKTEAELVASATPLIQKNPGGGLWLVRK
jgi:predicted O-methyltransferase YrrM